MRLRSRGGANQERLRLLTTPFDPENVFHHNHNIEPVG